LGTTLIVLTKQAGEQEMQKYTFTTFILFAVILSACTPSRQQMEFPKLTVTGTPVLHAIDSVQLRQLMNRMNSLMHETNLTEQEMDSQRRQAISQVIHAADGLEPAIDGILAAQAKLSLDSGEQKVFHSLAVNLKNEAHTLKLQAQSHQINEISVTLERMGATCTSCHELFRDFTKPGVKE
jgi:hypothetical protein